MGKLNRIPEGIRGGQLRQTEVVEVQSSAVAIAVAGGDEVLDPMAGERVKEAEFSTSTGGAGVGAVGKGVLDLEEPAGEVGSSTAEGAVEAEEGGAGDEGVCGGGEGGDGEGEAWERGRGREVGGEWGMREEGSEKGADTAESEHVQGKRHQPAADHRPDLVRQRRPVSVVFYSVAVVVVVVFSHFLLFFFRCRRAELKA